MSCLDAQEETGPQFFGARAAEEKAPANPTVPGYEILAELGRGAMGVVYKAKHLKLGRTVALKMILAGAHAGEAELSRFRAEAESVARLQHPGIVQIYEVGEYQGLPYFSMEFVDGGSLHHQLDGMPLSSKPAASLAALLAQAMQAAHERGILHRDLKPANVFLMPTKEGSGVPIHKSGQRAALGGAGNTTSHYLPKIGDFGLAKKLEDGTAAGTDAPDTPGLTASGAIMGTPSYMAPEQARGKSKEIAATADVYALGAILYELLTGRPPFRAATTMETLLQVIGDEPVPPRDLQPATPRDLQTICLKCLNKEPAKRYPAAGDLSRDLERYLDGQPIQARPVGWMERTWRWCRRNPALASTGALAALATLVTLVTLTGAFLQVTRARDEAVRLAGENASLADDEREQRQMAELLSASLIREQGLTRCEKGDIGAGLLILARGLQLLPTYSGDLDRGIRLDIANWSRQLHPLQDIYVQRGFIKQAAYSRDGQRIATANTSGSVQLWNAGNGEALGAPLQHTHAIRKLAFSPKGKLLATLATDGVPRFWHVDTGLPFGARLQHRDKVWSFAFAPSGESVLTGSLDKTARVWRIEDGQPITPPLVHDRAVGVVAFSPDGSRVVTGSDDRTARVWDALTGERIGRPLPHEDEVWFVNLSADGKKVLTGAHDHTVRLWEADTGKPLCQPLAHQLDLQACVFSPDGESFLTACSDGTARLWSTATCEPYDPPMRHQHQISAAVFSPDGKMIATASVDRTARLWDAATRLPVGAPMQNESDVNGVAFSPDGLSLLTWGYSSEARVWNVPLAAPPCSVLQHRAVVGAAAFSPDGRLIATGTGDPVTGRGELLLWDASSREKIGQGVRRDLPITSLAFSRDGTRLLSGGGNPLRSGKGEAQLWDVAARQPLGPPLAHQGAVLAVAFSPDGQSLLTGSQDGTARLWQADDAKPLWSIQHQMQVWGVAFSPDGKRVVTGDQAHTARIWDAATGKPDGDPMQHPDAVLAVAFSPDGNTVLTGSMDRTARLWDAHSQKLLASSFQQRQWIHSVAFSPDGRMVLTGGGDGLAQLWDTATGKPISSPFQHDNWVLTVSFSPNGQSVLTASADRKARIWGLPAPLAGEPERILRWCEVVSGTELDPHGVPRVLDAPTWRHRCERLRELGGPPRSE